VTQNWLVCSLLKLLLATALGELQDGKALAFPSH